MKTAHKIGAALVAATLLVALAAGATFWAFKQIDKAAEARKHTHELIIRADEFLSALRDAETGQRGYSLTGNETFLQPYMAVRDHVRGQLEDLRHLSKNSVSAKNLDALVPLVEAKMAELLKVIELRRNQDMAAVLAVVGSGRGKQLMDSIRVEMRTYVQLEEGVLAQHEAEFQSNMRQLFALLLSSLFTLLGALLCLSLIRREAQHRLGQLVHLETERLLAVQQETNRQLQQALCTLQVSEQKLAVTLHSIGDGAIATFGRTDGGHPWRGKYGRDRQYLLVRAELHRGAQADRRPRRRRHL